MTIESLQSEIKKISTWWRPWQSKENIFMRRLIKHVENNGVEVAFNSFTPKELFSLLCNNISLEKEKIALTTELNRQTWSLFRWRKPAFEPATINLITSHLKSNGTSSINSETSTTKITEKLTAKDLLKLRNNYTKVSSTDTFNGKNPEDAIKNSSKITCFASITRLFCWKKQPQIHPNSTNTLTP